MAIDVEKGCQDTLRWVHLKLAEIAKIPTEGFRKLLIYTLIDAFAQCWKNYPTTNNANTFASFLIEFAKSDILSNVCPATLFYHYEKRYSLTALRFTPGEIIYADDPVAQQEADRLLQQITEQAVRESARRKHSYAYLMYAERNKLAHELNDINSPIDFTADNDVPIPHLAHGSYRVSQILDQGFWTLNIPERYVKKILLDSVGSYLNYCRSEGILPFENNKVDRRCRFAWYDR